MMGPYRYDLINDKNELVEKTSWEGERGQLYDNVVRTTTVYYEFSMILVL